MKEAYRLLIGSVGDDSHSVGMALLEIAFRDAGYFVKNLRILNKLEDFFYRAKDFDAIFISCVNGHADLYVDSFPNKLSMFNLGNNNTKVWYIGGNLSVQDSNETVIRKYLRMGFDFVAPKPVSIEEIMTNLKKDLNNKGIKKKKINDFSHSELYKIPFSDNANDNKLTDQEFDVARKYVLATWPTGEQVWKADIKRNHSNPNKNLHNIILNRQSNNSPPLIQPRTGVAHVDDEIEILKFLRKNGLDVSSIQLDAASRKKMYNMAQEGVLKTEKGKKSFLNGYPVPIHGVLGVEEIVKAIDTPFQIRAGSPDHRLSYEIALAGGASAVEGGFLCYLYPYDKLTSPVESLSYWKYIDKLVENYKLKYNIVINREYFGPLTCCLLEPSIPICINIIQAILSAKWGVECISVGLAEQGNRVQDISAIRVLDKMTRRYLAAYGFHKCTVSTVYHHYMAAFPTDIDKARNLILNSSITGALAKATRIMTKTPIESIQIPKKEDNAEGLELTRKGIMKANDIIVDWEAVHKEMYLLEREVISIMKSVESLGQGSIAKGAIRSFENGILDIPFSPSIYNKNKLITAKDCDGAIRFVNPELLPFDEDIVNFHKEKIHQRMIKQRVNKIYEMLESDLTRIWKNDFIFWPLDGHYIN